MIGVNRLQPSHKNLCSLRSRRALLKLMKRSAKTGLYCSRVGPVDKAHEDLNAKDGYQKRQNQYENSRGFLCHKNGLMIQARTGLAAVSWNRASTVIQPSD